MNALDVMRHFSQTSQRGGFCRTDQLGDEVNLVRSERFETAIKSSESGVVRHGDLSQIGVRELTMPSHGNQCFRTIGKVVWPKFVALGLLQSFDHGTSSIWVSNAQCETQKRSLCTGRRSKRTLPEPLRRQDMTRVFEEMQSNQNVGVEQDSLNRHGRFRLIVMDDFTTQEWRTTAQGRR